MCRQVHVRATRFRREWQANLTSPKLSGGEVRRRQLVYNVQHTFFLAQHPATRVWVWWLTGFQSATCRHAPLYLVAGCWRGIFTSGVHSPRSIVGCVRHMTHPSQRLPRYRIYELSYIVIGIRLVNSTSTADLVASTLGRRIYRQDKRQHQIHGVKRTLFTLHPNHGQIGS